MSIWFLRWAPDSTFLKVSSHALQIFTSLNFYLRLSWRCLISKGSCSLLPSMSKTRFVIHLEQKALAHLRQRDFQTKMLKSRLHAKHWRLNFTCNGSRVTSHSNCCSAYMTSLDSSRGALLTLKNSYYKDWLVLWFVLSPSVTTFLPYSLN